MYVILSYDFGAFRKYLAICPAWYRALIASFDEVCNKLENDFNMKYYSYALFKSAHLDSSVITFCDSMGL